MKLMILSWCLLAFGCTDLGSGLSGSRAEPELPLLAGQTMVKLEVDPPDSADERLVMEKPKEDDLRIVRNIITGEYRIEQRQKFHPFEWLWKENVGVFISLADARISKKQLELTEKAKTAWTEMVE